MDGFGTIYRLDILGFYPYRNEITELLKSVKSNNQLVNGGAHVRTMDLI